jgi:PAS domain S-box-containing protein
MSSEPHNQGGAPVVLNVDDHEPARYAKSRILRSGGLQVIEAATGADALRLASERKPDLILLDVRLPDMNGFDVCRRIKADPETAGTLVVQNSASFVGVEDQVRGLEGGADTYIASPIEPAVLLATVKALLRLRTAERELAESHERFRLLVSQIRDYAIFQITLDGKCGSWNEGVEKVLGYSRSEFIGMDASAIFLREDVESGVADRELKDAAENGSAPHDRWMCRKGGTRFWAIGSTTAIHNAGGSFTGFMKVMRDQTGWKNAQTELARHRDELDALVHERTAELDLSITRLRMAERMSSLGTLAAGLGHDMGNLLLPLTVRLETLAAMGLSAEACEEVSAIASLAHYLQRLSGGLRLLASDPARAAQLESTEIRSWWEEAQPILRNTLPRNIGLHISLPDGECWVRLARASLTQIVFNIVQNAGDAMRTQTQGEVLVRVECKDQRIHIAIEDNGPGMSDEVARRCMEPYYSTKSRSVSTGLGLALVYGLVAAAHGSVELHSSPGAGTRFTFKFPEGSPPTGAKRSGKAPSAFVSLEDERIRAFVRVELEALGCEVRDRTDAKERTDILVTDQAILARTDPKGCVLIADCPDAIAGVKVLGSRPRIRMIRDAIREAWSELSAAKESSNGSKPGPTR